MNNKDIIVLLKKLKHAKELPLPKYATIHSAGLDLLAAIEDDIVLHPSHRSLVPTGISIALPDGYEAQIRPRSGLAAKNGITVLNAPGTIDADYRGEIFIPLINLGDKSFVITKGMRIAQMIIAEYIKIRWNQVKQLPESDSRGDKGFGSTGLM